MKAFLFILLNVLWQSSALLAQTKSGDSLFSLVRTYRGDISDAAIDNLGNLYLVSSAGQIKKYNSNGDSAGVYSGIRNFGKLYSLDVSNPLQPLLFYKDFSTIVLLDRFLANRTTVDVRRSGILQASAAGVSYDNNIWVFDEWDNKLKKLDEKGTVLLETADFRTAFSYPLHPQLIIDNNTMVYLADSSAGIFVFDIYGTYKKRIDLKGWTSIVVKDNVVVSTGKNGITAYNMQTFLSKQMLLPHFINPSLHSLITPSKVAVYSKDSLQVYQYRF